MKPLLLLLVPVLALSCRTEIPLVYDAENPAAVFAIPGWNPNGLDEPVSMLPDPLVFADGSRVKSFRDWPARRAEIATQLQFHELGVKPAPQPVQARMDGDTLRVDVTVGKETLSLSAVIHYPEGEGPFPLLIGASFITLPPALLADRPVATMNFNERQVTNYGQFGPRDDRGAYAFDRLGRPVSRSGDAFAYNPRGEVPNAVVGGDAFRYAYDHIGNRQSAYEAGVSTSYSANDVNQYTEVGNDEPEYDDDGNLVDYGTRTFEWSAAGHLAAAETSTRRCPSRS